MGHRQSNIRPEKVEVQDPRAIMGTSILRVDLDSIGSHSASVALWVAEVGGGRGSSCTSVVALARCGVSESLINAPTWMLSNVKMAKLDVRHLQNREHGADIAGEASMTPSRRENRMRQLRAVVLQPLVGRGRPRIWRTGCHALPFIRP